MFRWVKFGGMTVGAGLVVGLSVVAVMYVRKQQDPPPPVAVKPGTVGLDSGSVLSTNAGNNGDVSPGLSVTSDGNQGSLQGEQAAGSGTSAGAGQSAGKGAGGSGGSSEQLPTPSEFQTYDQYKNNPTALYIDVQPGTGKAVAKGSVVTMQYRGWLTNGQEFDETYARGKAFTFTEGAGTVVDGVAEAMFGMKEGGRRRLIIPPAVGHGAAGKNPIPPDAMMIFDVELVSAQ
jgi:FKBP-type peptidyl-prolyl cis-trans isomerase FkpA